GMDGIPAPPENIPTYPGGGQAAGYHHAPTTYRVRMAGLDYRDQKSDNQAKCEYTPNLHECPQAGA
ncbi:unnamed protein product, partial [marine sediment metagenome]